MTQLEILQILSEENYAQSFAESYIQGFAEGFTESFAEKYGLNPDDEIIKISLNEAKKNIEVPMLKSLMRIKGWTLDKAMARTGISQTRKPEIEALHQTK